MNMFSNSPKSVWSPNSCKFVSSEQVRFPKMRIASRNQSSHDNWMLIFSPLFTGHRYDGCFIPRRIREMYSTMINMQSAFLYRIQGELEPELGVDRQFEIVRLLFLSLFLPLFRFPCEPYWKASGSAFGKRVINSKCTIQVSGRSSLPTLWPFSSLNPIKFSHSVRMS
jgi:hypothetical protein